MLKWGDLPVEKWETLPGPWLIWGSVTVQNPDGSTRIMDVKQTIGDRPRD